MDSQILVGRNISPRPYHPLASLDSHFINFHSRHLVVLCHFIRFTDVSGRE